MRPKLAVLAVIIVLLATALSADQLWPQPVSLYSSENMTFAGKGCASADGGYALVWMAIDPESISHMYFQRFNSQNQPQSAEPVCVQNTIGCYKIISCHASSDGNYIALYNSGGYYRFVKIDPSGNCLWVSPSSIYVSYDSPLEVVTDLQGGAYFSYQHSDDSQRKINRLDSSGNYLNYQGATLCPTNANFSELTLLVQPDNSVFCGLKWNNQLRLMRVSPTLQISLDSTAYPDSGMVLRAKLRQYGDGSLAWVYYTAPTPGSASDPTLKALKMDVTGNQLWPEPITLLSPVDGIYLTDWSLAHLADNLTLAAASYRNVTYPYTYVVRAQKFDPTGNTYWADAHCTLETIDPNQQQISLQLLPLAGQNSWLCIEKYTYNGNRKTATALFIDDAGFAGTEEIAIDTSYQPYWFNDGTTYTYYPPRSFFPFTSNGLLTAIYQQFRPGQAAIFRKNVNSQGAVSDPISLRTSVYGMLHDPVLARLQNNIFSAWIDNANFNLYPDNLKQIRYQIVDPEGNPVLPIPGNILSGGVFGDLDHLRALNLADGNVVLLWAELSSPRCIRAQLIDPAGNQLWEPEGRIIVQGNQYLNTTYPFKASVYEGSVYIVWGAPTNTAAEIRGQKLVGGVAQWESQGRILIGANDVPQPNSNGVLPLALEENYLVYGNGSTYGQTWLNAFRFDSAGEPLTGFAPGGNQLFNYPASYNGILYVNHLSTPQGLVVASAFTNTFYNGHEMDTYYDYTYGQLMSPAGTLQWGEAGAHDYDEQYLCADASGIYISDQNVLKKLNYQRNLVWQEAFDYLGHRGTVEVDPGSFIGLSYDLKYYTFSATGSPAWPHDYQLSGIATENERILALDGSAYVSWGYSSNYYSSYYSYGCFQHLLQRVNASLVAVDDPAAPALEGISLLRAYPNPFSAGLNLRVACSQAIPAKISIHNLRGQLVKTLWDSGFDKGESTLNWDGTDDTGTPVSAGIYLCRLSSSGKNLQTVKLVRL